MKNLQVFLLVGLLALIASNAAAQTHPTISYQGLLENNGTLVTGTDTLKLLIYTSETGGTPLYTETQATDVINGVFNIAIGSVTPLQPTLDFTKQYYLGISVNGGAELSPRSIVSFAPYAFRALNADTASYSLSAAHATSANQLSGGWVSSINGQVGSIGLSGTNGITIANTGDNFTIGSTGVQSVNLAGGKLTLVGAGGTTIADTGTTITIRSATFSGGTGIQAIQNSDSSITIANGSGPIATITLARQNASSGQVLEWNGTAWRPATVSGSSGPDSIKDLQDARDDGSSVYLGSGSGTSNFGLNRNVALGILALHSNTTGNDNTAVGDSALMMNTTGNSNVAVGTQALTKCNSGGQIGHVAVGAGALQNLTGSNPNTALGYQAMNLMTGGGNNTACGSQAMLYATDGSRNSVFGDEALQHNSGSYNSVFGYEAMLELSSANLNSGSFNCAFGNNTLTINSTGNGNTAIGSGAMANNDSGASNVAIGVAALFRNTERSNLVAIGDSALYHNGLGSPVSDNSIANTAVGSKVLYFDTTGSYNTGTGFQALYANSSGYRNTGFGYLALNQNTTGNDNTAIGSGAGTVGSGLNNTTALGSGAQAMASNQVVIGNANVTSFYCQAAYAATTANSANMVVASNGQIMRSTSSARYKTNIHDLDVNTDKLYDLRPVSYTSKIDGKEYFGLVAEDVAKVLPDLAEYAKSKDVIPGSHSDELIPDAVKYPMLSVLLLEELKKEHAKAESQEKTIADLARRVEALEASQKLAR